MSTVDARQPSAKVGPNAIIQLAAVLSSRVGHAQCARMFAGAGLSHHLAVPPDALVDEAEAARLFLVVETGFEPDDACDLFRRAGRATADYILAHRIPHPAQTLLRHMPAFAARRLLLLAISKHAWTFAGSGAVSCTYGPHLTLRIAGNPLPTPGGVWHIGVLHRLFEVLVASPSRIAHTSWSRSGVETCQFEIAADGAEPGLQPVRQAASSRHSPIAASTASAETGRLNR